MGTGWRAGEGRHHRAPKVSAGLRGRVGTGRKDRRFQGRRTIEGREGGTTTILKQNGLGVRFSETRVTGSKGWIEKEGGGR